MYHLYAKRALHLWVALLLLCAVGSSKIVFAQSTYVQTPAGTVNVTVNGSSAGSSYNQNGTYSQSGGSSYQQSGSSYGSGGSSFTQAGSAPTASASSPLCVILTHDFSRG